jgi:hypothetical protein
MEYIKLKSACQQETEPGRITVPDQSPYQKVCGPNLNGKKLDMVVWAYHPSKCRKHKIGGFWTKSKTLSPKISRGKYAGGIDKLVEHLPSKS